MFAFRKFLVKYRLWIGLVLIGLGIYIGIESTWWIGWLPILIGLLTIVAHFLIGPVTLLQRYVESGDVEGAKELIDMVKFPNFSTMNEDLDGAEAELKKSLASGVADKDYQGTAYLQLGTIANRKGNTKEAFEYLRKAVGVGLPDGDSNATAYLQLCSIAMQRRDFRGAKMYFSKAQSAKSKNPQILEQIAEVKKYIARIPG
jgi:tetratricopeptide (TPR) repeat protein